MANELMTKRIPVSEARWKQLGRLKQAGQTYDELLRDMVQAYNRQELAARAKAARAGKGSWHPLESA